MRAASSAFTFVYSRFDPGGVSSEMLNSDSSVTGKNSPPTMPSAGSASAPTNEATASMTIFHR